MKLLLCHSHLIKPLISALKYCSSFLCVFPSLDFFPFHLFSTQPVPAFKMEVRSCHSSVQNLSRAFHFTQSESQRPCHSVPALRHLVPPSSLPSSPTFQPLLTPFSHPDFLAVLKYELLPQGLFICLEPLPYLQSLPMALTLKSLKSLPKSYLLKEVVFP